MSLVNHTGLGPLHFRKDNLMLGNRTMQAVVTLSAVLGLALGSGCVGDPLDDADLGTVEGEVALPPPTGLTATAISPTRIDLAWNASPGASYYIVYRGTAPNNETALTSVLPNSYISNYLTPGTQYCWKVRNANPAKEISGFSNEVCVTTPATPTTPA